MAKAKKLHYPVKESKLRCPLLSLMIKRPWAIVVALALLFAFTSAKEETGKITYSGNETIYDEVLETVREKYNETTYVEKSIPYSVRTCTEPSYIPYRYDYEMSIDSETSGGKRLITCIADVANLEDRSGNFTFYVAITRSDGITSDYLDQTKEIAANSIAAFMWEYETDLDKTATCTLKAEKIDLYPRCEKVVDGVTRTISIPKTVEKERNITVLKRVPRIIDVEKESEGTVYVNRMFGYRQGFYLGY